MNKKLGPDFQDGKCPFTVWAPFANSVQVEIVSPKKQLLTMEKDNFGYWQAQGNDIQPGTKYWYVLDKNLKRPDPASRSQPDGVHQPSQVVNQHAFDWKDPGWKGIPLKDMIIYELHTGTFTPRGTFQGIIEKLDYLKELGINTIEIMPVAQFPGERNWGYDGVYPFAVQHSYGGVNGLKQLVDACHQKNMAVILDVVYNHMGPEGNYLADFGPYFTDKYKTPWGMALNFDDDYCDHVRNYFLQNALMWLDGFHIDGLRLDAVHAIMDLGAKHFLKELREEVDNLENHNQRPYELIAESDMNDIKLIKPMEQGGYGINGQWFDDFHHAIHTLATGESDGYYTDYGKIEHLAKAFQNTFVYNGIYSSYRKRTIGNDASGEPGGKFVVCSQNHDQVGNRMLGDRLSTLVSFEMLKLMAGTVLISPYVPMLFMGEEYGETKPFLYFVSHTDPGLVEAVRKGRKEEFETFKWQGEVPDPQSQETFEKSKLNWDFKNDEKAKILFSYYQFLIKNRKEGKFSAFSKEKISVQYSEGEKLMIIHSNEKTQDAKPTLCVLNFSENDTSFNLPGSTRGWGKFLDSAEVAWNGPGGAESANIIRAESIIIYQSNN